MAVTAVSGEVIRPTPRLRRLEDERWLAMALLLPTAILLGLFIAYPFFEGVLLFLAVAAVWRLADGRRRPGLLTGVFCFGYGAARIAGEFFREPDAHLGYLWGPLTMGMLLSVPMLVFGGWLIARAYRRPRLP